jgi:ribonuclease BN (tRNA processing enzyme)
MPSLRVLGSCGAWPEPGRACAGFVLEYDGFRILLDLGYAALPRLLTYLPDGGVDAVLVTHRHPDHCVDVSGLARVRQDLAPDADPLPLYCEPGVVDVLRALEPRPDPATVFDVHDLAPGRIGPFRLDIAPTPHHIPNHAVRLEAPGLTVVYTGDSGPLTRADDPERLVALARDADLFVADATLQDAPPVREGLVMTAAEAGTWAARSGVRRLLLTHFWPFSDRSVSVERARSVFDGEILAAEEDLLVEMSKSEI